MPLDAIRTRRWCWAVSAAALTACISASPSNLSSSTSSSSSTPAPSSPACPSSYAAAIGAGCTQDGQTCEFIAPCGAFGTPGSCVCTGGTFTCTAAAAALALADSGAAIPCAPLATMPTCPTAEALAREATCTDIGLQCAYPSACPSIPEYDECQCVAGRTDTEGIHFECATSCNGPDSDASDDGASTDDASPSEASLNEESPPDGAESSAPSSDGALGQ